jgi:protein-disulfide isomerase
VEHEGETLQAEPAPPPEPRSAFRLRRIQLVLALVAVLAFGAGFATATLLDPPDREAAPAAGTGPGGAPPTADAADDDAALGPADAPITLVEFSDFACTFCKRFRDETLDRLLTAYEGQIRFVYRDLPLTSLHPRAQVAAEAAECAGEQGAYWLMHDVLFAEQDVWRRAPDVQATFRGYAEALQLDAGAFEACVRTGQQFNEVQRDFQAARAYGFSGTPSFVINGRLAFSGAHPFETFRTIIERELLGQSAP